MNTKSILGIVSGLQATSLVMQNLPKSYNIQKMDIKPNRMVKMGMTNLVGIGLIKPTAQMINAL